jgi:ribosomal protein S18 acetylase RimI-like enzyme
VATEGLILPGQVTLVASWQALARLSSGARLVRSPDAVAAVFPTWAPLNNAIGLAAHDRAAVAAAVVSLHDVYADAGVDAWAFWAPSAATDLDAPDTVRDIHGLTRDTTTLVMATELRAGLRRNAAVVRTSIAAATRAAGDEPVAEAELDKPDDVPGLSGWVALQDGMAVAGGWSILHDGDCGIYTVGTLPQWRRRGLAKALTQHVLADAYLRGARTATLQSTRMGQPLYESLGFEPVGRYEEWIPRPGHDDAPPRDPRRRTE